LLPEEPPRYADRTASFFEAGEEPSSRRKEKSPLRLGQVFRFEKERLRIFAAFSLGIF
jgi:hypothetical protein